VWLNADCETPNFGAAFVNCAHEGQKVIQIADRQCSALILRNDMSLRMVGIVELSEMAPLG